MREETKETDQWSPPQHVPSVCPTTYPRGKTDLSNVFSIIFKVLNRVAATSASLLVDGPKHFFRRTMKGLSTSLFPGTPYTSENLHRLDPARAELSRENGCGGERRLCGGGRRRRLAVRQLQTGASGGCPASARLHPGVDRDAFFVAAQLASRFF